MKRLMLTLAVLGQGVLFAADPVTVSTTAELVEALETYNGTSQVIQLESNEYVLPDEPMFTDNSSGYGAIYVNKVTLIGLGEKPEDVKLIGNGKIRAAASTAARSRSCPTVLSTPTGAAAVALIMPMAEESIAARPRSGSSTARWPETIR